MLDLASVYGNVAYKNAYIGQKEESVLAKTPIPAGPFLSLLTRMPYNQKNNN